MFHVSPYIVFFYFMFHCQMLHVLHKSFIICFVFVLKFSVQIEPYFSVPLTKSLDTSLGPIRYTIRSKDGSKRMRGVMCYENAKLLRPVRKLTALLNERRFAYCNIRVVATCPLKGGYQDSVHQKGLASPCIVDRRCRPDGLGGGAAV